MTTGTVNPIGHDIPPDVPIPELLDLVLVDGASDLHLTVGSKPVVRMHGDLQRLDQYPELTPQGLRAMIYAILPQRRRGQLEQDLGLDQSPDPPPRGLRAMIYAILPQRRREQLEQDLELDMSSSLPGRARFRVNVYFQRDSLGAASRLTPYEIKPVDTLGLPPIVTEL